MHEDAKLFGVAFAGKIGTIQAVKEIPINKHYTTAEYRKLPCHYPMPMWNELFWVWVGLCMFSVLPRMYDRNKEFLFKKI